MLNPWELMFKETSFTMNKTVIYGAPLIIKFMNMAILNQSEGVIFINI